MKLLTAIIQPDKLTEMKDSLFSVGITKMTVSSVQGCGRQAGYEEAYRGNVIQVNLLRKVRVDIALNDDSVEPCIEAIISATRTGKVGDGKIFIRELEECIRIRTGERGSAAIG